MTDDAVQESPAPVTHAGGTPPEYGTIERRLYDRAGVYVTPFASKVRESLLIGADYATALDVAKLGHSERDLSREGLEAFIIGYQVGLGDAPFDAPPALTRPSADPAPVAG